MLFVLALAFGPPFLALCQLLGFVFDKEETASQYIVILLGFSYGLPNIKPELSKWLSPITMLGESFSVTLDGGNSKEESVFKSLWPYFLTAFLQLVVLLSIVILIDHRRMQKFRGIEDKRNVVDRV